MEARGQMGNNYVLAECWETGRGEWQLRKTRDAVNRFMPVFKDTGKMEALGNGMSISYLAWDCLFAILYLF